MRSEGFHLAELRRHAMGFCALAAVADLGRPVTGCGSWRAIDLISHLGSIERWAETIVRTGRPADHDPPPADPTDFQRTASERLLTALVAADPRAPVWTLAGPGTASFWFRRQAHEHAVHHWDLARSQGSDIEIDPTLAADGVDEVVTMVLPRQVSMGRITAPSRTVELRTTDTDHHWRIGSGETPEAELATTAVELYLLLWGRRPVPPGADITGDPTAIADLLQTAIVP